MTTTAAFFDLDRTLILGASAPVFQHQLAEAGVTGGRTIPGLDLYYRSYNLFGENPVIITGSFNWSASATTSNDEFLLVMRGDRVRDMYREYFDQLWSAGRRLGGDRIGDDVDGTVLAPGDLVINEVMWYGVNHQDADGFDEFVEIRNTTDRLIDLDQRDGVAAGRAAA